MTEVCIDIPVENIAGIIKKMSEQELETLCILLGEHGPELLNRKDEMESGKVRPLSKEEIFDV
jgi:hypothetical protein